MAIPEDWWKDFFSGLTVEMWRAVSTPEDNRTEAAWIEKQLQVSPPAKLLDVPCGDGRLALELAARGFEMTGVDLSREFLAAARKTAEERGLGARFEQRDMRDLAWKAAFDGAFTFGNSFGYLGDQGDGEFLAAVGRALKPGARFVMDTKCAEMVFPTFNAATQRYQFGGITTEMQDRYDPARGRVDTKYTFSREGEAETKWASERLYTFRELRIMLESAGFAQVQGFGSLALEPLRIGSPRLYVTATRSSGRTP